MATEFPRTLGVLAVGVDDCQVFPALNGAAKGADTICDWATDQGCFGVIVHIEKFTDAGGAKVGLQDVQRGAQRLVARGLDALVVYLSGHGIVKTGDDEHVLLSEAATLPGEAISVASSFAAAWLCGVPHVIIVSDACRSPVSPTTPAGKVAGNQILFSTAVTRSDAVDIFYASGPYAVAYEVNGEGLLTDELNRALTYPERGYTATITKGGQSATVVVPTPLAVPLAKIISRRAAALNPPRNLLPDFRVTSGAHGNCFFGFVDPNLSPLAADQEPSSAPSDDLSVQLIGRLAGSFDSPVGVRTPPGEQLQSPEGEGVLIAVDIENQWRRSIIDGAVHGSFLRSGPFDSGGFFVVGARVEDVICPSARSIRNRGEGHKISSFLLRAAQGRRLGTAAFLFEEGTCTFLPVFEGYVGRVSVRSGLVESLSYRPAREYRPEEEQRLDEYVSAAEVVARSGRLSQLSRREGSDLAGRWRRFKQVDPMLGVFSAYAYSLTGNVRGALSVFEWMRNSGEVAVPFDVCMLAGMATESVAMRFRGLSPFVPLLTLGWSIAQGLGSLERLHPAIQALAGKRLNALYSTFVADDASDVLTGLRERELR